ncbi:tRNA (adenosine(37)-N6)-threonylcarbamoyltransferase complex ATPase subunit type 1 TsaE [Haematobacter massiliensis]|uniref:tRNA threonylcarbamoyladenosine biosynthesis protein TsaE n=1 Tax=Haematobacter massiliensis TaxID=195105 RepID=A0A086Y8H3_9RHOB|nr:tRNA (adenosine(37)-N6)-threonylcarbamoyltransferase complex ATPase subunit type 1 TsaE [Haematobacter massiliensis]KFI30573.1 ATP-binding protein [Haematobacter massiliensis]OWJ71463.1 tRNA (adenosine(37)-N6)-threonylcarbamoyltransferase complex ATPase subunit type 1 TsaE [Haematobacter massiliensis]OWJ87237.1 tRNA (adenosine(37)-N6)-threonylcarbamoyltransferase complex ATPase subunit type 1 TsaE [Haematobacter massiliensis]QBJ25043.1 tRNA (adenosine(37)-N6)-threonylcarbamoyltransferase com
MSGAPLSRTVDLASPEATDALARSMEPLLRPGDVLLLDGSVGAGKSHFARALIRARFGAETEVPSPTFTLVQTYGAGSNEIWHSDLYRLSHPDEIVELGLEDAFTTAITLVEWPDRLGSLAPEGALALAFRPTREGESRSVTLTGNAGWATRLKPLLETLP